MSSTSRNLRRSRRAPKKLDSEYKVGDVVSLGGGKVARLSQLLTEGTATPNPRWLVEYDTSPYKEEVYEYMFKTEEEEGEESPTAPAASPSLANADGGVPKKSTTESSDMDGLTGSETSKAKSANNNSSGNNNNNKKAVSFSAQSSLLGSDESSSHAGRPETDAEKKKKMSAREARSRRRQALMEDPLPGAPVLATTTTTTTTTGKRKISGAAAASAQNKRKRVAAASGRGDEPMTKVKLLTGTLFIYKGKHRRVEFVRRV